MPVSGGAEWLCHQDQADRIAWRGVLQLHVSRQPPRRGAVQHGGNDQVQTNGANGHPWKTSPGPHKYRAICCLAPSLCFYKETPSNRCQWGPEANDCLCLAAISLTVDPGRHYIVVHGPGRQTGDFTLDVSCSGVCPLLL